MLFTSLVFVFLFLPVSLLIFILILRSPAPRMALPWLALASVVFYIWDDVRLLPLFLGSVIVNFVVGTLIYRTRKRTWMWVGILFNVGLIAIFKYADFAMSTVNELSTLNIGLLGIALPLGISFFTFTQIAWLVDMHTKPKKPHFWNYLLFVSFFPHLIAGPILHHAEMMPQFDRIVGAGRSVYFSRFWTNLAVGVTIFIIGLFKKVMIADSCALIATTVFNDAQAGKDIHTFAAWGGVLAYTMQIYFDFSGYSDMAVGIARMFGIRLPINFFSPYKSSNIIEFWRRWHMTLSRFLRDYIYFPLGGSRRGATRRYANLMTTMLVGGLWHGASWTFVLWGGLHGAFLVANHAWNHFSNHRSLGVFGWLLTFFAVANTWVLFRAGDMTTALNVYKSMYSTSFVELQLTREVYIVAAAFLIAVLWPNTYEIMRRYRPVLELTLTQPRLSLFGYQLPFALRLWRPDFSWAVVIGALAVAYLYAISRSDAYVEFIYFQF